MQVSLDCEINRCFIFPMKVIKQRDAGLAAVLKKRGAAVRIASELGITPQAINGWSRVPANRVIDVERITGVPRHVQRPDVFRVSEDAEASA